MEREVHTGTFTRRVIYVCCKCKAARTIDYAMLETSIWYLGRNSRDVRFVNDSDYALERKQGRCECGGYTEARTVRGRKTEHKCGSKCLNAKTSDCECSCGGQNHGVGYVRA